MGVDVTEPDRNKLREALEPLNELADKWWSHVKPKFALAIAYGVMAPFSYVMKQLKT